MDIYVLVTGGTISLEYDLDVKGFIFSDSHIQKILMDSNNTLDITVRYISLLDSNDFMIDNESINKLKSECINSQTNHIIILTGTDKMSEIGSEIMKLNLDKTIILTGSMVPYSVRSTVKDATFNFGCAIGFVQTLPSNTYIAMNGKYWIADKCKKDFEKNIFIDK